MVVYVMGHGWHDSSQPSVQVPPGLTVSFLADFDLAAVEHMQYAQLVVGSVAAAQAYQAGDPIPNYQFSPLDDAWIARATQLNVHDLALWFIGPEFPVTALCTGTGPDCATGQHTPGCGLFGWAQALGVDHLHMLSCRVDTQTPPPRPDDRVLHLASGDDPSFDRELFDWTSRFITLDFAAQRREWEALPYQQQVYLTGDAEVRDWSEVYQARLEYERCGGDPAAFAEYYRPLDAAIKERLLREFPEMAATVLAAGPALSAQEWQDAETFLAMPPGQQQDDHWRGLPAAERERMLGMPEVNDWAQALAAREYLGYGITHEVFRGYCAKLRPGALAVLTRYPAAEQILWPATS